MQQSRYLSGLLLKVVVLTPPPPPFSANTCASSSETQAGGSTRHALSPLESSMAFLYSPSLKFPVFLFVLFVTQIVLAYGEYTMLVRSLPSLGAPAPPERPSPFPKTPFHALQLSIGKLKGLSEQIILQNNAGNFSAEFKGNSIVCSFLPLSIPLSFF